MTLPKNDPCFFFTAFTYINSLFFLHVPIPSEGINLSYVGSFQFEKKNGTQEKVLSSFFTSMSLQVHFHLRKAITFIMIFYTGITKHFALKFSYTVLAVSSWNKISSIARSWTDPTRLLRFQTVIYLIRAQE